MNMRWHQRSLRLCVRAFGLFVTEDNVASGFARGILSWGVERCEKCDQGRGLRRAQILAVRRHVAASLDHLSNQLILREPHGNAVERGPSLATQVSKGMAIAALFGLKNKG